MLRPLSRTGSFSVGNHLAPSTRIVVRAAHSLNLSVIRSNSVQRISSASYNRIALIHRRDASNVPKSTKGNPLGLDDPSLFLTHGVINGRPATAENGKTFEIDNPATGKTIGTCPDMNRSDTKRAIEAAHKAFQTFKSTPPNTRQGYLLKLHQLMLDNTDDLTRLIVWENGKSWTDAAAEVAYSAGYISWFAGEAVRTNGETIPCSLPGTRNFTVKQPVGVCSLLVPWNFPAGMIARKIGPVLATGCTAVIKTPAETPYTNLALVELAKRAGVPDGVLNVVTTHENIQEVGEELTTNPLVKKVSFTGSTRVGKMLAKNATDTLKKLSLELGGNAPLIVFDDAHLPTAVAGTIASKFRGSGQTCVCANRIYVHDKIYDKFASLLAEKVKAFKVGSGFDDGVTHGPLIHSRQVDKVQQHLDDAVSKGAKVLVGGKKLGGNMFQPTVLADVPQDCLITGEETFGPLAALIKFSTEEEVIKLANATEFGLAGYLFSQDSDRIWRVSEALQVGIVGANTGAISQPVIPFGGVKESGYGKEGGHQGTEEYMITKYIAVGSRQN